MEKSDIARLAKSGKTTKEIMAITGFSANVVNYWKDPEYSRRKNVHAITERRRRVKKRAVEHKGRRCTKCGYTFEISSKMYEFERCFIFTGHENPLDRSQWDAIGTGAKLITSHRLRDAKRIR